MNDFEECKITFRMVNGEWLFQHCKCFSSRDMVLQKYSFYKNLEIWTGRISIHVRTWNSAPNARFEIYVQNYPRDKFSKQSEG